VEGFKMEVIPSGTDDEIVIIKVTGELDVHTVPEMDKVVRDQFDKNICKMVFDLSGLDYTSSAGIGIFMNSIKLARGHGGDIKISSLQPRVKRVLDLLGFTKIFEIFETNEDALKAF